MKDLRGLGLHLAPPRAHPILHSTALTGLLLVVLWCTVLHCGAVLRMRAVMVYLMRFESAFSCSMRLMRKFDLFFLRIAHNILLFRSLALALAAYWPGQWPLGHRLSVTLAGCGILSEGQLEKAASQIGMRPGIHCHKWPSMGNVMKYFLKPLSLSPSLCSLILRIAWEIVAFAVL